MYCFLISFSPEIAAAWDSKKTVAGNLRNMGLAHDPNLNIKGSNVKKDFKAKFASTTDWKVENSRTPRIPEKKYVAELLEKEANAPRLRTFQLPSSQVEWVTYLMDKYGTDYKAMVRDKRNHYQETWKQIRAKIKVFMSIPEQYAKYLQERGLLDEEVEINTVKALVDSDDDEL